MKTQFERNISDNWKKDFHDKKRLKCRQCCLDEDCLDRFFIHKAFMLKSNQSYTLNKHLNKSAV